MERDAGSRSGTKYSNGTWKETGVSPCVYLSEAILPLVGSSAGAVALRSLCVCSLSLADDQVFGPNRLLSLYRHVPFSDPSNRSPSPVAMGVGKQEKPTPTPAGSIKGAKEDRLETGYDLKVSANTSVARFVFHTTRACRKPDHPRPRRPGCAPGRELGAAHTDSEDDLFDTDFSARHVEKIVQIAN